MGLLAARARALRVMLGAVFFSACWSRRHGGAEPLPPDALGGQACCFPATSFLQEEMEKTREGGE